MLNPRRDATAGAYRGIHACPLPSSVAAEGREGQDMDARDKRGHGDGEVLDLIGTRSKARSRQVLGD
jgi:hypothetical protein